MLDVVTPIFRRLHEWQIETSYLFKLPDSEGNFARSGKQPDLPLPRADELGNISMPPVRSQYRSEFAFNDARVRYDDLSNPAAAKYNPRNVKLRYPNTEYQVGVHDNYLCFVELDVRPKITSILQSIGRPQLYKHTGAVALRFFFKSKVVPASQAFQTVELVADALIATSDPKRDDFYTITGDTKDIDGVRTGTGRVYLEFGVGGRTVSSGNDPAYNNRYLITHEARFTFQETF